MPERTDEPRLRIDTDMDPEAQKHVQALDKIIRLEPERARRIIEVYAEDPTIGDAWMDLLNDKTTERRYPFRLTAALGSVSNRQTMRYIEFDSDTDKAIAANGRVRTAVQTVLSHHSAEDKERASRRVGLLRLSVYAGELAALTTVEPALPAATQPKNTTPSEGVA
jgi:hypothetical protein